jgi:Bacterial Ig-like domain (group 3)/FG-GAP-like repeat
MLGGRDSARSAGQTVRRARAAQVLAALLGLLAAIFFSDRALAQPALTITNLSSEPNPSQPGQLVDFSASVQRLDFPCSSPTGTVTFLIDGSSAGTVTLSGSGAVLEADFPTILPAVGTHTVVAHYNGSGNCLSSSDSVQQVVSQGQGTSDTGVSSNKNPIGFGKSVTFTAHVFGVIAPCSSPKGTVTFLIDGSWFGTVTLLGGMATFTTNTLAVGTHTVVAQYSGDGNCSTSSGSVNGGQVVFSRTAHDFNGDLKSDIAWRDSSGNTALWLINSAAVLSSDGLGTVPLAWSLVGQHDFDRDGNADLLWRDSSGNTSIWFMSGTTVSSSASLGNIPTTWSVIAVADFNGDGKADIFWRDGSGNVAMWLMNGATVSSSSSIGNVPLSWPVVGSGDYNGDGNADLLWRDSSGNVAMWLMNGATVSTSTGLGNVPTVWSVIGTGDFNGDFNSDILWRDTGGNTSIWFMNGTNVGSTGTVGNVPTNWSVALVGDYNADGKSDLLWRDNLGSTLVWFMNGAAVSSTGNVGNIPTSWTVQSVNAE